MKKFCIIIRLASLIMVTFLAGWPTADTAQAWMRHWHDDYGPYDDYHHHYRHFGYPPYGYTHRYHPKIADRYTEKDAWELVENNRSQKALEIFEKLAGTAPSSGRLKLGAAVAAADTGQLSKSVRLMRQVLQYNPGAHSSSLNRKAGSLTD